MMPGGGYEFPGIQDVLIYTPYNQSLVRSPVARKLLYNTAMAQ